MGNGGFLAYAWSGVRIGGCDAISVWMGVHGIVDRWGLG